METLPAKPLISTLAAKEIFEATLPCGPLETPRQALSPLAAAAGGMVAPALIYLVLSSSAVRLVGAQLPRGLHVQDLVVVGIIAAIGFTVSLFFAAAAFSGGSLLVETKMGALLSFAAAPLALFASWLLKGRGHLRPEVSS